MLDPFEPVGIAGAVPALVMVPHNLCNVSLLRMLRKDLRALGGVCLDDLVFLGRQLSWFQQNGIWDCDFAKIMEDASDTNGVAGVLAQMEEACDSLGHFTDPL